MPEEAYPPEGFGDSPKPGISGADGETPSGRRLLLTSPDKPDILDASLALASQGIRHWIEFSDRRYALTVDPEEADEAAAQLALWQEENRGYHPHAEGTPDWEWQLSPLLHLALPAGFWFFGQTQSIGPWIKQRGLADAEAMLRGEWWRSLTATTLHADNEHLLGNLLSGYFVLTLLGRRLGFGQSLFWLTLAAAFTNAGVALMSPDHRSLGFSTVVFAGLGLMSGMETLLRKRPFEGWRRVSPLLAAFFLAIMTGLGENSDIRAHFGGFFMGAMLSIPAKASQARAGSPPWQLLWAALGFGAYAVAWWLALR